MIKMSAIAVTAAQDAKQPNTMEVRGKLELDSKLFCIPEAQEETIREVRLDIWMMMYRELLKEVNEFVMTAVKHSGVHHQIVKQDGERLLNLITPEQPS